MNIVKINGIPEWAIDYMKIDAVGYLFGKIKWTDEEWKKIQEINSKITIEEQEEIVDFMEEKGLYLLLDTEGDRYFSSHPAFGPECMVYDCWFEAKEGVVGDEDLEDDEIFNEGFRKKPLNERKNDNYTHFAVHKKLGKILNGWDYSGCDPEDLKLYKRDYFLDDLKDMELNPKDYKILTYKTLMRLGIDPDDKSNWLDVLDVNALNEGFKGFKKKALNTVLIFSLGMNAAFVLSNLGKNEKEEIVDTVKEPVQQSLENTTNQVPDDVYVNSEDLCFKYENLTDEEARDLYNRLDSYEDLFGFVKNKCGQKTFNKLVRSFALQLGSSKDYAEKAMKNIPVKVEVKKKKI